MGHDGSSGAIPGTRVAMIPSHSAYGSMDRRVLLAVVLMMTVLIVPSLFLKRAARPSPRQDSAAMGRVVDTSRPVNPATPPPPAAQEAAPQGPPGVQPSALPEDTIVVTSPLYRYAFSTRGARMIGASFTHYPSMHPDEQGRSAQILDSGSEFLALGFLVGRDTIPFRDLHFIPSAPALEVAGQGTVLNWSAEGGGKGDLGELQLPSRRLPHRGIGPDPGNRLGGGSLVDRHGAGAA